MNVGVGCGGVGVWGGVWGVGGSPIETKSKTINLFVI